MKTSLYKGWMDTIYKHCRHCLNRKTMPVFIRELLVTIEIEEVHRQILLYLYLFTNIFVSQSLSQIFARFLQLFVIRERKERRGWGQLKMTNEWIILIFADSDKPFLHFLFIREQTRPVKASFWGFFET